MLLYTFNNDCQVIILANVSNNAIVPRNKLATKNANRIIRKGEGRNLPPCCLPTPMTAFTASFNIRTLVHLNPLQPTS